MKNNYPGIELCEATRNTLFQSKLNPLRTEKDATQNKNVIHSSLGARRSGGTLVRVYAEGK